MTTTPVPGMGAIPITNGFAFRVWAPNADAVSVVGDFNDWDASAHPLISDDAGNWYTEVPGAHHGQEYKYVITNGEREFYRIDPRANRVTNSVGNGVLYDHARFDWGEHDFCTPALHELVIYETHIGSFVDDGDDGPADLADLTGKLSYLRNLGVNAIELMPLMEFAGDYSWGYNPAHIFAVESSYGGPDALKNFIKHAHQAGIAVIIDVVYNHFGPSDLSLWQFDGWSENDGGGIYFYQDHRASTPWGDTRPDYGRQEVRDFIVDNARMWLRDYRADGLRLDMTPYMRTIDGFNGPIADGWRTMARVGTMVREEFPGRITIAEDLHNDAAVTDPDAGAMHAQWDNQFVHPIRATLIADSDEQRNPSVVAKAISHAYHHPFDRVIYTESHDEVANGKARIPTEVSTEDPTGWKAQKLATLGAALVLTTPGVPMLFQGQEFLEDEWFRDTVPLDWSLAWKFRDLTQMFRDLIALRRNLDGNSPALSGPHTRILHADDTTGLLAFCRATVDDDHAVIIAANFTAQPQRARVELPSGGMWRVRFNSDARRYSQLFGDHPTADLDASDGSAIVDVAPYSAVIYLRETP
ncbi:MAG: alpha-amylase family glycosyl hydrolase [Bowdeniella nasicola]|nr:alpha-amylase family glycosyl hydrolase [Bowdeniella nasicola]